MAEDGADEAVVEKRKALFEQVQVASLVRRRPGAERGSAATCSVSEPLLGNAPLLGLITCCAAYVVV